MHYLIIAVLAFALSMLGCEGKTGPAGPTGSAGSAGPAGPAGPQGSTGPQGPAGADGADGAQGPAGPAGPQGSTGPQGPAGADGADGAQGPAGPAGPAGPMGPEGPMGPAGEPGAGADDANVHHIAFAYGDDPDDDDYASAGIDDMAAMRILRDEEKLRINAVARAQNGDVVEGVDFEWDTDGSRDAVEIDPSDDTMSAMVTAEETGETMITVTAVEHSVAAEINVEVTAKAGSVTLMVGEDEFEVDDSYFPGDVIAAKLTAVPDVKHRDGSNVAWNGTGAVKVTVLEDDNPNKRHAKIEAKSAGTGTVTAMYEGKKASFNVVVSGPTHNRAITYLLADDTFEITKGTAGVAAGWDPGTIVLEAVLEDDEGDPLAAKALTAAVGGTAGSLVPTIAVTGGGDSVTGTDGTVSFTITAPTNTTDGELMAGSTTHTITLKSLGAKDVKVRIYTVINKDPTAE